MPVYRGSAVVETAYDVSKGVNRISGFPRLQALVGHHSNIKEEIIPLVNKLTCKHIGGSMRSINIDRAWKFNHGLYAGFGALMGRDTSVEVNLPHDYMIESEVKPDAAAGPAGGYFTEGVAHYTKLMDIPAEWENDIVYLSFDGVMMNATIDVNGGKAALQHYGYAPFCVDITPYIYCGKENRVTITVNPSMQPNCRWYSGAGIFRSVSLIHVPKLHIANDGIFAYTKSIEYDEAGKPLAACMASRINIVNKTLENKMALVKVWLTADGDDAILVERQAKIHVNPNAEETAYISLTLDAPLLWDCDDPNLYRLYASVTDLGEFRTHHLEKENGTTDEADTLFGIRTITVDARHGLRINNKTVKLKGGCLHHDNGILGAVSLYDAEARKLSILKKIGFNAVRTTHNPPSAAFMEACDRLGIYVFDEAFDAWGIMKQPGDYNMFFETDWEKDLTAFIMRDRNHPSVIIWSTGNEIPERGGLNNGYTLATKLANHVKSLDMSRPVSNGICSFWNGLDEELTAINMQKLMALMSGEPAGVQNVDFGTEDLSWETCSEAFTNGLDIVGYNYMEDKYPRDHELYPERVILGSENYPKEIGKRWPMVESSDYVVGDFTWTACDYIGEAGIGKSVFMTRDDPRLKMGPTALMSHTSEFPWRLANDADVDINGNILPQGYYRSIVWGSEATALFSYDPATYGQTELLSMWGFTAPLRNWSWAGHEGKPVKLVVFSRAEEVEILVNGVSIGRKKAGEALAIEDLPLSFVFEAKYEPGEVVAISYTDGREVSRDVMATTGAPAKLVIVPEKIETVADGHSLIYVPVEVHDENGCLVNDAALSLNASVSGSGELLGFGSANPITAENYTTGRFTTYQGRALAIIRSGYVPGEITLTVKAEGLGKACCSIASRGSSKITGAMW